jgi:hypothetical protein
LPNTNTVFILSDDEVHGGFRIVLSACISHWESQKRGLLIAVILTMLAVLRQSSWIPNIVIQSVASCQTRKTGQCRTNRHVQ